MRKYSLLLVALAFAVSTSHAQPWIWTRRITDSRIDSFSLSNAMQTKLGSNTCIATDKFENIVTAQGFVFKKTTVPTYDRNAIRIAKYDNKGNTLWANYFESPGAFNVGSFPTHVYDMKLDKLGNIYLIMRNFKLYDSANIGDGNTANCLVKLNANGKFLWKKQIGQIEDNVSAPQYCRLALSPHATHLYAYVQHVFPSLPFLDSTYTKTPGEPRFILCKIDSAGRILKDLKFPGISLNSRGAGLDVNRNDDVLITGSGYSNIGLADTTIEIAAFNPNRKSFIALFRGSDLSRKWTRVTYFVSNPPLGSDFMSAVFASNGDIGFLLQHSRSGSDAVLNKQMVFGPDTINILLSNIYENPHLHITDSTGKIKYVNRLSSDSRVLVLNTGLATDGQNNFYATGSKSIFNAQFQERFVPIMIKLDNQANRIWTNRVTGTDSILVLIPVPAGMGDYPVMLTSLGFSPAPVFGPDTLGLPNCSSCGFTFLSAIGGKSNVIRGNIFHDYNSNHVQDPGENPAENLMVSANNGQFNAVTDRLGNYLLITDTGTYQVTIPSRPRYYGSFPASHTASFNSYGLTASDKDFALTLDTVIQDVSIDVTHVGPARPGFNSTIVLFCRNNGTMPVSGYYTLKLDSGMTFLQSDSTAILVAPDSIRWNYGTLFPGEEITNSLQVNTAASVPIGSIKKFAGFIYPYQPDTAKENNSDTAWVTITGSYDPNDKLVNPFHTIIIDSIQTGKQVLEYTIRFQNTGTDTAFNIHIADTLSPKLDFSRFRLVSSSHPVELQWKDPGILHCFFRNILLPDSNRNEPRSHGFVKFTLVPKTSLTLTDTIYNKAAIYFDYNLPIVTNRVSTAFRNNIVTPVSNISRDEYQLTIHPNPVESRLYYTICCFAGRETIQLEITDMLGRKLLLKPEIASPRTVSGAIHAQPLAPGLYILRINGRKGKTSIKFIKR